MAVGCAVGIPVGVGILIVVTLWFRLQKRLEKEDERDRELNRAVHEDDGSIDFDRLETMREMNPDCQAKEEGATSDSGNPPEKVQWRTPSNQSYYVPAYRRKINTFRKSAAPSGSLAVSGSGVPTASLPAYTSDGHNSSTTSLTSSRPMTKRQASVYDQMIPVLDANETGSSAITPNTEGPYNNGAGSSSIFTEAKSNDNLIRNLNNQDFGSFPKRPSGHAMTRLNGSSMLSLHTRGSSVISLPQENVFATPVKGATTAPSANLQQPNYQLQNNYDLANSREIAEEDQYENEFTNYSENKREFIDSIRPKQDR